MITRPTLDEIHDTHRILSAHRCSCGWEGDSATAHIIDTLQLEPYGWVVCSDEWRPPWDDEPDDYDVALFRLNGVRNQRKVNGEHV